MFKIAENSSLEKKLVISIISMGAKYFALKSKNFCGEKKIIKYYNIENGLKGGKMKSLALNLAVARMEKIEDLGGYIENIEFGNTEVIFLIDIESNKIPKLYESDIKVIAKEKRQNEYNRYYIIYKISEVLKRGEKWIINWK